MFRRKPEPAKSEPTETDDELVEASVLADFVGPDVGDETAGAIAEALSTADGEAAVFAAGLAELAEKIGEPEVDVAHHAAEAERFEALYAAFLRDRGIALDPAPDRRIRAADTAKAAERRRSRLERRLETEPLAQKRNQITAELARLERAEDACWELLQPSGARGEGRPAAFCRCGLEISRRQAYRVGRCPNCHRAAELITGTTIPEID